MADTYSNLLREINKNPADGGVWRKLFHVLSKEKDAKIRFYNISDSKKKPDIRGIKPWLPGVKVYHEIDLAFHSSNVPEYEFMVSFYMYEYEIIPVNKDTNRDTLFGYLLDREFSRTLWDNSGWAYDDFEGVVIIPSIESSLRRTPFASLLVYPDDRTLRRPSFIPWVLQKKKEGFKITIVNWTEQDEIARWDLFANGRPSERFDPLSDP